MWGNFFSSPSKSSFSLLTQGFRQRIKRKSFKGFSFFNEFVTYTTDEWRKSEISQTWNNIGTKIQAVLNFLKSFNYPVLFYACNNLTSKFVLVLFDAVVLATHCSWFSDFPTKIIHKICAVLHWLRLHS